LIRKRFLGDEQYKTEPDTDGPDSDDPDDENPAPPLFPLTRTDYIGFGCAILGLLVAAGGGIGGGGILVPIYILVMDFNPKNAIPLSQITVFGGSIANTIMNSTKRHPSADRPLVNWDIIFMMQPLTIGGTIVGAYINEVLPTPVLVILLVSVLGFTAYNTLKKAYKMFKKESAAIEAARLRAEAEKEGTNYSLLETEQDVEEVDEVTPVAENSVNEALESILEEETHEPVYNIVFICFMFAAVLAIDILKGGGGFKSPIGLKSGSFEYVTITIGQILLTVFTMFAARGYLLKKHKKKEEVGYEYLAGDVVWDERATVVYPILCSIAGIFAGMFGIGGGLVIGPLMIAMNVHPKVAAGTLSFMIFFTSGSATISYIIFGLMLEDYALVCILIGFFATVVGKVVVAKLMAKNERNSIIAFCIGFVVLLSAILMIINTIILLVNEG